MFASMWQPVSVTSIIFRLQSRSKNLVRLFENGMQPRTLRPTHTDIHRTAHTCRKEEVTQVDFTQLPTFAKAAVLRMLEGWDASTHVSDTSTTTPLLSPEGRERLQPWVLHVST